jgi:hypothetical protein
MAAIVRKSMSIRVIVLAATLAVVVGAGFAAGRATAPETSSERLEQTNGYDVTLRVDDQLHVPELALFCVVSTEVDIPRMLCNRTGLDPRYQVIFERGRTHVGRVGFPGDETVYSESR